MASQPRYPVYVLSKGRFERCLTARFLENDGVDYTLVVEAQEEKAYRAHFGRRVVVLPPESTGRGAIPVRNWIWKDAIRRGAARHWCLDDNIVDIRRLYHGKRIPCDSGPAFRECEDFTERFTNVGVSGMNYKMFAIPYDTPAFLRNVHVYSCMLIDSSLPCRWRGEWNADTDLCLQVLSLGLCTILFNVFVADKIATMTMPGGNTDRYQGDGRLRMARALERMWPGVVEVRRKFGRPQHSVNWQRFAHPLILRPDAAPVQRSAFDTIPYTAPRRRANRNNPTARRK